MTRARSNEFPIDRALSIAALVAALALTLAWTLDAGDTPEPVWTGATNTRSSTGDDLVQLRARVAELEQRLLQVPVASGRTEVINQARIDEMVARALAARAAAATTGEAPVDPEVLRRRTLSLELARQLEQAPFGAARDELWQQLQKAGDVDAAVDFFEQIAAANPGSPDAQTQLGNALIQKMLGSTDEQQRIEIGKRIEQQFDRALELQPNHWEARFQKAVGLSYAPPLSGRQGEAIQHFEKLVAQQANAASAAGQSQTYVYLGRLYAQRGDTERARQVWLQGLARHPGDAELQQVTR